MLTAVILRGIPAASDAIFDSLFERINAQSAWLHTRLNEIESNTSKGGSLKGQEGGCIRLRAWMTISIIIPRQNGMEEKGHE